MSALGHARFAGRFVTETISGRWVPNGVTPFVVIFLPRTGSNLLASMLDSHPDVLCHHEVFNPTGIHRSLAYKNTSLSFGTVEERDRDPWAFMKRVYQFTDGATAVGFKLGPEGLHNWPLLSLLLTRRIRKIIMERRSWLHAYTSGLIALQTQVWSRTPEASEPGAKRQTTVRVDPARFRRWVRKRELFYRLTKTLLRTTGQPWITVAYEDIGKPETNREVLEFLGVGSNFPLTGRTEKQNSASLRDRIENYDELAAALSDTPLAPMLEARDG